MCGIAGVVDRGAEVSRRALVERMKDLIAHRGPDDEGTLSFENVTLGHRRLSIFDLSSAGHQPMFSGCERYAIVHNGEVYNFPEIKRELESLGHTFRTQTDTEVILEAYARWGSACVSRFNGMWAFVILDRQARRLFVSRDRLGIKPLYVHQGSGRFAFASEIKALLGAYPELRDPSKAYIHHFLPGGALDDGSETFFPGVESFPAGSYGELDLATGAFAVHAFWQPTAEPGLTPEAAADPVEYLRQLLGDAVALRLRSDVAVGSCLSGGIDSSAIVGMASEISPKPVHTFSGLYADDECDEREYVASVNAKWATQPHGVTPEPDGNLRTVLTEITWHQDEPTAGPGLLTQYYVMQQAQQHVKVLLDGQGGDELFAGYLPYMPLRIHDLLNQSGIAPRVAGLRLALQVARHWGPRWLAGMPHSKMTAPFTLALGVVRRLRNGAGAAPPSMFEEAFTASAMQRSIKREYPNVANEALSNALYWHTMRQSIPALLHYEDRNSMAFGIEARVPLLDYRIVEFAFALPNEHKIKGSWTKWILREASRGVLPDEVRLRRSKMGYPTPFARWLRQANNRDEIAELLLSRTFAQREIVPASTVEYYWTRHQAGEDHGWLLYRLATLELWFRIFIDQFTPTPAKFAS